MARRRRTPELTFEESCMSTVFGSVAPVATNSQELCKAVSRGMRVSDRTIRNHIEELLRVGILLKKKFKGTKANYLLWINPLFLVEIGVEVPPAPQPQQAQSPRSGALEGTIFPLIEEVLVNLKEKETSNVDKLVLPSQPGDGGRFNFREEEGGAERKKGAGGAAAAPEPRTLGELLPEATAPQVAPEVEKPVSRAEAQKLTEQFVYRAWEKLYTPQGVTFNEEQARKFKNTVWAEVYNGFPDSWPRAEALRYHSQALERVDMAARYYAKYEFKEKYPPLPYGKYEAGRGYFETANQRGFANTMGWLIKKYTVKLNRKITAGIKLAKREFRRCLQGNDPLQRTIRQVYQAHEIKLAELGEHALNRFHNAFKPSINARDEVTAAQQAEERAAMHQKLEAAYANGFAG
jgi:hypothetical protein